MKIAESVVNLRDAGGYPTRGGGRVRTGILYRSNELTKIIADDMHKIAALQLKYVYDLRTPDERFANPDELPAGVNYLVLDVAADSKMQVSPAKIREVLMTDPKSIDDPGGRKFAALFKQGYRDFVSLPSARAAYRDLFMAMSSMSNLPALFHCTGGKDRTGWANAALLTLIGVPGDIVMNDYLLSNDYIIPKYQFAIDAFTGRGGDPEIIMALLSVRPEYLNESFDEVRTRYGTIEAYFADGLGIDKDMQQALGDIFVQQN